MKRPPPSSDEFGSSGSKKRRRISISEDDDSSRPATNQDFGKSPPMNRIYNSACRKEKPDELFRKDLISAMKLPDNEQLDESEFWDVSDAWKQEWERGVQVPVNSKNVPNPNVRPHREKNKNTFKLPKKFMRTTEDSFFSQEHHVLIDTAAKAENVCKYDLDDLDCEWLKIFNDRRHDLGLPPVDEDTMERVLEDFETQCSNRFQDALKTEKGLGIEYDEDVICDVCRSPDCEEGNEMVFCDSCNICVHQACYGITAIPEGSWICKPCALNVKPICILCPNLGGAMKNTSSGDKWAHVSCALWVPEVSIGCPEKMEPVTRISNIPASRWALICSICRERNGACIQCSVKQCKVAYHVTCAFENGLEMEMKTTALDSSEEGVKMQSFCPKHCKSEGAEKSPPKPVRKTTTTRKKKEIKNKDIVENEVDEHNARLQKIRSLEAQFHRYVSIKDTADLHHVDAEVVDFFYFYWILKRRAKFNKPLLITKCDEANLLIKQHENLLYSRLKMFVHLRQDLERVRNLCYMVGRREKIFRSFMRAKRDIVEKQLEILTNKSFKLNPKEKEEVMKARFGTTLFERYYCSDVEEETDDSAAKNASQAKLPNPYAKSYVNNVHTRSRRRTTSQNLSDPIIDNCDSESNEMPILVKCKSEENLSIVETNDKSEPPPFTNSRFIKLEIEDNDEEPPADSRQERKHSADGKDKKLKNSLTQETNNQLESKEPEMPKINSENLNTRTRKHSSANESSSDKNSLCLSDKENINALNPFKIKKTRTQAEGRHQNGIHELTHPKLELFDDEMIPIEISSPDIKKNFRFDKKNARYPTRNRRCSSEVFQNGEAPPKSLDSVESKIKLPSPKLDAMLSPSNGIGEISFLSPGNDSGETHGQADTPRRRRGRPRKIKHIEVSPEVSFTVIKKEVLDIDSDKNNSCDVLLSDSSVSPGFRMSLRHTREISPSKRPRGRKPKTKRIRVKLENPEASPLKEANKNGDCPPEWDTEDARPATLGSPEQPSFERIVIRLRKDANGESWKNDSSSSESFRIVHNDLSENSVSEFPSVIKYSRSLHNQSFDGESRHRYSMRERAVAPRTVKSATERS